MKRQVRLIRPGRKTRRPAFELRQKWLTALLLAAVFGAGLWLALLAGRYAIAAYLFLWAASYPVIYAGTCRDCPYYGKKCPVPLEGGLVHRVMRPGRGPFGCRQLLWAAAAYLMRGLVPVFAVFQQGCYGWGLVYVLLFAAFWIVHLRFSGCPNCINENCPLNPDYSA